MNLILHYTPTVQVDIAEIGFYLAQRSRTVEDRFYKAVDHSIQFLLKAPRSGERRSYSNPEYADMRVWQVSGFSNYLIFYRADETTLTVVRVIHGARDYDTMFNE